MRTFWLLLYNLFVVPLLYGTFYIAALFNSKISRGILGRRTEAALLPERLARISDANLRCWIHISSLGEFEQARPVLQLLKQQIPDIAIIVSFFSPSGYDNVKNIPEVDVKTYLPFDSFFRAKRFIAQIKPDVAAIIRHDIWPNHVWQLQQAGIPLILIDAAISEKAFRLYRFGRCFFQQLLAAFSGFLAVSPVDHERLKKIVPEGKITVIGDTRYDQVYHRARETSKIHALINSNYFASRRVLVAGSIWPSDEKHLLPAVLRLFDDYSDFIFIGVPHEPTPEHVLDLETFFRHRNLSTARFSALGQPPWDFKALIIDSIGILANLYALGTVAFVGGSFGPGVHSVLEPAAHGCPVLFGPVHRNSQEAILLTEKGGGFSVKNDAECYQELKNLFIDVDKASQVGKRALSLVLDNVGASQKAVAAIKAALEKNVKVYHTGGAR